MKRIRVIPILTVTGNKLVKTVKFRNPNYIGDPINAIKIFNDKEVDEIAVIDIRASKEGMEPNYRLIGEMASECFMPLAYGGGIRNFKQAQEIFRLGVEKVILNSASRDFGLIRQLASNYGNQSVVICVDLKKALFGNYKARLISGTKTIEGDVLAHINTCISNGAGEVIIQDIDRDGTFEGYNIELLESLTQQISVPVIALGGASSINNMKEAIETGKSNAVAAGSLFVYKNNDVKSILINYPSQELLENIIYKCL